jgi:steroid delta-isomerase-like uncharacterized protein
LEEVVSEENKASQRRFIDEVQNKGNIDVVDELIAADCVDHTPFPGLPPDREGARQVFQLIRAAFPDHDAEVVHLVAEGDMVATYKTFTGTHEGEFMGISPTGKKVTIRVMDFVRYRDGQIAEHWNIVDQAGLLQQLDAMPA